ncbi:hypothetical protein ES319_A11G239100v1 [Gossypium barbadense]|uniref:Uncharacterized protein n=2 Tax=Gossypium TaxID=3633 RepID=A0A5J5TUS8_GOSBA|nr:hypothetical protein ES319_A11G239100v1 [Gossypium barbadense]TYG95321.1 hypothetical protein ES288_A11G258800v1 [Gossypium darwinii]
MGSLIYFSWNEMESPSTEILRKPISAAKSKDLSKALASATKASWIPS